MKISEIRLMYDYHNWANHLLLEKASYLTDAQLHEERAIPYKTLRDTFIHMLDADNSWRHILQHNVLLEKTLEQTEAFPDFASILAFWKQEEADWSYFLDNLTDIDMERIVRYEIPEGRRERVMWHCLYHVVNHGSQHRAEAAAVLSEFGYSEGGTDFTRFLNHQKGIYD
jgi:uncharacterized damage-inducible protein DinB